MSVFWTIVTIAFVFATLGIVALGTFAMFGGFGSHRHAH
jgi:hypothetical protein